MARILIVDDDDMNLKMAEFILRYSTSDCNWCSTIFSSTCIMDAR